MMKTAAPSFAQALLLAAGALFPSLTFVLIMVHL